MGAGAGAKAGAVDALEDGPRADVAAKAGDVTTPAIAGAKDDDGQGDVDDFVASFPGERRNLQSDFAV